MYALSPGPKIFLSYCVLVAKLLWLGINANDSLCENAYKDYQKNITLFIDDNNLIVTLVLLSFSLYVKKLLQSVGTAKNICQYDLLNEDGFIKFLF